ITWADSGFRFFHDFNAFDLQYITAWTMKEKRDDRAIDGAEINMAARSGGDGSDSSFMDIRQIPPYFRIARGQGGVFIIPGLQESSMQFDSDSHCKTRGTKPNILQPLSHTLFYRQ